jgi:DNA-binding LytR/AlgR family response regulator
MRILLIEDELPAARQLTRLIQAQRPAYVILETLDSVSSAVQWLQNFPAPDLIFMDIQIADGLSFDIFKQVSIPAPVIFTTAFDQYAVQAFKVNAIDYLLKPIDPKDLTVALERVEKNASKEPTNLQDLLRFFQPETYKERFLVKTGQHFTFIQRSDIGFFRSSEGLTQAYCFNGKKHFVDHTLEELERLLPPRDYFRVSRSVLLHSEAIQKIHPNFNGRLKIEAKPAAPEEIFVSRDRVNDFKNWLGG